MYIYRFFKVAFLFIFMYVNNAYAGISLDSTRIIFQAKDAQNGQSIGVTSSAQSTSPYLVKTQVLGNITGTDTQSPFSVTPALFRLDPGTSNQLRILKTGDQKLATNKESLFYLRVMALPSGKANESEPKSELGGAVMVSVGSIIKLFYRPAGLTITPQQGMASLRFSRQGNVMRVTNPSPYYVTLKSVKAGDYPLPLSTRKNNTMIAPFGEMTYPLSGTKNTVSWQVINDYGGLETFHGTIQ